MNRVRRLIFRMAVPVLFATLVAVAGTLIASANPAHFEGRASSDHYLLVPSQTLATDGSSRDIFSDEEATTRALLQWSVALKSVCSIPSCQAGLEPSSHLAGPRKPPRPTLSLCALSVRLQI